MRFANMADSRNIKTRNMRLSGFILFVILIFFNLQLFGQDDDEDSTEILFTETEPQPEMNLDLFAFTFIKYPTIALNRGYNGKPIISFMIGPNGDFSEVKIVKPFGFGMDEEALGIMKLMEGFWVPGKVDDRPVKVRMNVPVVFRLAGIQPSNSNLDDYKQIRWYIDNGQDAYADSCLKYEIEPKFLNKFPNKEEVNALKDRETYLNTLFSIYKNGLENNKPGAIQKLENLQKNSDGALENLLIGNLYRRQGDKEKACLYFKRLSEKHKELVRQLIHKTCN